MTRVFDLVAIRLRCHTMAKHSDSVLIVDRTDRWGGELRDQLAQEHVRVYVVSSYGSAIAVARSKPVAVAVVENDGAAQTDALCRDLQNLGVEAILNVSPSTSPNITAAIMRPKRRMLQ
jgi:ActR/RegA family two-component response regulator